MTPEFLAFTLLGSYIVAALALLFLGAQLIRHDRTRNAARSPSHTLRICVGFKTWLRTFFARTNPFAPLLSILTALQHPLR
jgi:hypothetical protein